MRAATLAGCALALVLAACANAQPELRLTPGEAVAIARGERDVRAELARHRTERVRASLQDGRWTVVWRISARRPGYGAPPVAEVVVDDRTGRVLEAWTGVQAEWVMARGLPGAFGRAVNDPLVWVGLCLAFLLPFARPPWGMAHVDLIVVLAGFSLSYAAFSATRLDISTPTSFALLAYVLARMVWVTWHPPPQSLRSWMSTDTLALMLVFLVGFRVALNLINGNVIDVGYAGVIGADRWMDGNALYGFFPSDNEHGDTYGPVNYLAYMPFELLWPWSGSWDSLPAAHAATIVFDLAALAMLYLLGRRVDGHRTGLLLSLAWAAFPFSVLVLNSNANDTLMAALVLCALLVPHRAGTRGAVVALAGLTKFAPFALVPLLWGSDRLRFAAGATAAGALAMLPVLLTGDLPTFYDRTLWFQGERLAPFTMWGHYEALEPLRFVAVLATVAFGIAAGFLRRPAGTAATAALATAVLVALQMALAYWFYLYLAWFVPLMLVALLVPTGQEPGAARSSPPAQAASSG